MTAGILAATIDNKNNTKNIKRKPLKMSIRGQVYNNAKSRKPSTNTTMKTWFATGEEE